MPCAPDGMPENPPETAPLPGFHLAATQHLLAPMLGQLIDAPLQFALAQPLIVTAVVRLVQASRLARIVVGFIVIDV